MRTAIAGLLLATTCLAPAWATDFNTQSRIDSVIVYPQGADVTRIAEVKLPAGDHRIILSDLPASVDPRSIRVEGDGSASLQIASVDTKSLSLGSEEQDQARRAIEKDIETLTDERSALDQTIADSNHQRQFLLSLADKQLTPQSSTETIKGIDVVQMASLLDLVEKRLAALTKTLQTAQLRQKQIDEKVNELSTKLAELAPDEDNRIEAAINVSAEAEMTGTLRISYRLNEASWLPYYDARMATPASGGTAKLEVVRRAEVVQSTSETWDNVALTLSTTRPTGATSAPDLGEEELFPQAPQNSAAGKAIMERQSSEAAPELQDLAAVAAPEPEDQLVAGGEKRDKKFALRKNVAQSQAAVELAGFQANYVIQGRVTVDNTGTAKKVRISSAEHDARLEVVTTPRLDANAYLTASFEVKGEGPMLPGQVNLYRDGVYVGQGALPLLNPKEEAKLGFGVDDLVKVERKEVKRTVGEEGIITSSNVEEQAWDITVKNLHDIKMDVKVFDRMPFSASSEIEIETLPGMTEPAEKNFEKKRGVLVWSVSLEPRAENVIKTGYRVTWPKDMRIGMSR